MKPSASKTVEANLRLVSAELGELTQRVTIARQMLEARGAFLRHLANTMRAGLNGVVTQPQHARSPEVLLVTAVAAVLDDLATILCRI